MRDETTPNEQKQRHKWGLFRLSHIAHIARFCRSDRDNARTEMASVVMFVERRNDQRRLL